jgi:hypothetical protein
MKLSRLRPGSGLGLGFGAFFASFLPLSLLPMNASVPQKEWDGKSDSLPIQDEPEEVILDERGSAAGGGQDGYPPERGAMTFLTIVETMAGHDLNHLGQLRKLAGAE